MVNYVKSELANVEWLQQKTIQLNYEAENIIAIMKKTGGSFARVPENNEHNPHKNSVLYDKLILIESEIDSNCLRIEKVEKFLKSLDLNEKELIVKLHLKRTHTYSQLAKQLNYSREGLRDKVNSIIVKNW